MSVPHRTILLVEDHKPDVRLLEIAMRNVAQDVKVDAVSSGDQALEYLCNLQPSGLVKHPDVILLDLNVPGLSGKELLSRLKTDERFRAIPVVILSSSNYSKDIQECYRLHANCYLRKPASISELEQLLRNVLNFWGSQVQLP